MNPSPTSSIKVITPDGTLFVHLLEDDDGRPIRLLLNIGKNGYSLNAWASALAQAISLALRKGASVHDVIESISNITSDGNKREQRNGVRSGPEGVVSALMRYVGVVNDSNEKEEEARGYRPARFRHLE